MCFDNQMSRRAVNRTLSRLTGYELRKSPSRNGAAASRPAARAKAPAPPRKADSFPKDYDDELVDIIRAVRPFTLTGPEKLHALISAARYIVRAGIPGDVVECGVWRGGTMQAVARTLDRAGDHSRDLRLYDRFDEPADDKPGSLADVRTGFDDLAYPKDRLHFVAGPLEGTIPAQSPGQIAILRLDCDGYDGTARALAHLYDRVVPGGVLLVDDYGWSEGSRRAVDEFIERSGEQLLLVRAGSGRIAVKR